MAISKKRLIALVAVLALAALAAAVALVVCLGRGGAPAEPADPYAEPYGRMKDPDYLRQIKVQRDDLKEIMRRMAATRAEIAALGDDTNSAKYAELRARLESEAAEVEKNRILSQTIVRERMRRENEAIEAKQKALKQKGN